MMSSEKRKVRSEKSEVRKKTSAASSDTSDFALPNSRFPVPRLRFPEFRDAPTWKQKPIETLARVTQGGTPDTSNPDYWGGPIHWLTPAEMSKGNSPYIDSTNRTLTEDGLHYCSSELLPMHSVIVSTRAPIGHLAINTVPMAINQGCRGLIPIADAHFLYYSLLHAKPRLMDFGAGNTFKELSGSALKRFEVPAPEPAEQQKIAECLGSLDDLIAAEGRKLAALRDHKQGLMQQLFPREGETRPRLRFSEFKSVPDWEEKPLREVCSINPPANGLPESFIYIDLESVLGGVLIKRNWIQREDAPSRAQRLLQQEDVIFQIVRPYQRNNLFVDFEEEGPFVASTGYAQLRAFACKRFLYQAVHNDVFVNKVIVKCTGSSYPAINSKDLAEISLPVPPTEDEQHRIADCLASLDAMITAQAEKLEALRTHKRGLMQQLFPATV